MAKESIKPSEYQNSVLDTAVPLSGTLNSQDVNNLLTDSRVFEKLLPLGSAITFGDLVVQDSFFTWLKLETQRHNQLWPYELVIAEAVSNGSSTTHRPLLRYVMPLPPSSIGVNVPAASNIGVTLKGFYEEHNAAPLRHITVAGTTGIQPFEGSSKPRQKEDTRSSVVADLFGNTVAAVGRVTESFGRTRAAIQGVTDAFGDGKPSNRADSALLYAQEEQVLLNTGYAWFQKLARFLDFYLALKKTANGKNVRLLFLMHKDQAYYSCSLRGYNYNKLPGTLEYKYTMNLVAWRRHKSDPTRESLSAPSITGVARPGLGRVASVINAIRTARRTVSDAVNVLRGIRQDVSETFIKPLKEAALLLKATSDAVITAADLPGNIIQDLETGIKDAVQTLERREGGFQAQMISELEKKNIVASSPQQGGTERSAFGQERERNESFAQRENEPNTPNGSPLNQIFQDPDSFSSLLDEFDVTELNVSESVSQKIEDELDRVSRLDASYFRTQRDNMENFVSSITDALGGGNASYRRIKDLPAPGESFRELTVEDALLLAELEESIQSIDSLISLLDANDREVDQDYAQFYANLALANDIPFVQSNSKFWVPFPHGYTLDQLAARYLGDSNRWIEIAAINGLREPFVDEEGFEKYFISSASGNTITLQNRDDLYIGQKIVIRSDTQVPTIRKIVSIDFLSAVQTLVRVDGEPNLNGYTLEDNGRIQAFLPDTVNSNNYIAIPSTSPVNIEGKLKTNPDPEDNPRLIEMAKVDFKLTSEGDLALTSRGDVLLSFGLANLVQAALIKLHTPQQSIVSDPPFGNPLQVGTSTAEIDVQQSYKQLEALFTSDPRFARLPALQIRKRGPAASIDLLLDIAETGIYLPVTTEVPV